MSEAVIPAAAAGPKPPVTRISFRELIERERAILEDKLPRDVSVNESEIARPGRADEPWMCFTKRDDFGVALSGGGIRSATFNLGLLQALAEKAVLRQVDYLSTVSGGGYVGGMWSAWRYRQPPCPPAEADAQPAFPEQTGRAGDVADSPPDQREPWAIRHLREFSRFLIPRVGVFQSEMWSGILTILGGMVASLIAASAALVLLQYLWFETSYLLLGARVRWSVVAFMLLAALIHYLGELAWRRTGKSGGSYAGLPAYVASAIFASAMTGLAFALLRFAWLAPEIDQWFNAVAFLWLPGSDGYPRGGPYDATFSWALLTPALAWLLAGAAMLVVRAILVRPLTAKNNVSRLPAYDRALSRCLAPGLGWLAAALIWETAHWLHARSESYRIVAGGPLVFGLLFALVKDWLTKPRQATLAGELVTRVTQVLKPLVPQVLAIAAMVSFLVVSALAVQVIGMGGHWFAFLTIAGVALFLTLLCFDPAKLGMHDFYRARISRCFLGAARANGGPADSATSEQPEDDILLSELSVRKVRPIHLICATANNLAGDTLTSLYRGARSAVLSGAGVSLGDSTAVNTELRLSSALTASAAAFNSQMGRLSMDLGPAVAFVMAAFNLRLGLWVPNPLDERPRPPRLPALLFFREMLGQTNSDPAARATTSTEPAPTNFSVETAPGGGEAPSRPKRLGALTRKSVQFVAESSQAVAEFAFVPSESILRKERPLQRFLHLSDGGHFENLALYELIRRHCRYIIVSDCGADPQVAFDDLANAIRCIREDFGVEIELDVAPLRPGEHGRSRQHAVVGTIHYDGPAGLDKGTIVYFKPTLTGDEPPDVLQYQTRNAAFPHESTGDQFYDEAQWESYRRLGEHAGHAVFCFADSIGGKRTSFVEKLFLEAGRYWHPAPERQSEVFVELTERCARLESDVRDHAPATLRAEFFPEVAAAIGVAAKPGKPARAPTGADDTTRTLYFLMLAGQVMEDAWLAAELNTYWSHPLNEGWMNYFQRWASTPSFRRWWPVLRPIYSIGFRDFVKDRFDLRVHDREARPDQAEGPGAVLNLSPEMPANPSTLAGLAWAEWQRRYVKSGAASLVQFSARQKVVTYSLSLDGAELPATRPVQVGFLIYTEEAAKPLIIRWRSAQLFVPNSLVGAGFMARLLDAVIARFQARANETKTVVELHVLLDGRRILDPAPARETAPESERRPNRAERFDRVRTIGFYKSRGFVYASNDTRRLVCRLAPGKPGAGPARWRAESAGNGGVPPDRAAAQPDAIGEKTG